MNPLLLFGKKRLVPGYTALYRFDEGTGAVLTDYSGNGYNGTLAPPPATPTWAATGLSFDGGDAVSVTLPATITAGSVVAVVNPTNFDATRTVFCSRSGSGTTYGVVYTTATTGILVSSTGSTQYVNGSAVAYNATAITAGTWQTIAATTLDLTQNGGACRIGSRAYSTVSNAWLGGMAALVVYPYVLTDAQVAQVHAYFKAITASRGIALP